MSDEFILLAPLFLFVTLLLLFLRIASQAFEFLSL
jgi:hypothetical protein